MTEMEDDVGTGVSNRTLDIVVAAVVLAFALLFLYTSYKLGFRWGSDGPQSGFFPFYVSLFIALASLGVLWRAVRVRDGKARGTFVTWDQFKQVLSVAIPATVFVVGIQVIGIYLAAAIYIALFMRFIGKYGWTRSVLLGVIIAVVSFMMFEVWFQVPLYKGLWNPLAWTGY